MKNRLNRRTPKQLQKLKDRPVACSRSEDKSPKDVGSDCLDDISFNFIEPLEELFPIDNQAICKNCDSALMRGESLLCSHCLTWTCNYCAYLCSECMQPICQSCYHPKNADDEPICPSCLEATESE